MLVYGHASGTDVPSLLDDVARFRELGYKAIRAQAAVPDVGGSYGVRKGAIYEPAATVAARRAALVHRGLPELRPRLPAGGA